MFYDRLPHIVQYTIILILVVFTVLAFTNKLQAIGNTIFDVLLFLLFIDIVILKRLQKKKEE